MGQTWSFGLTQYDMEELKLACGGKFSQSEIEALYKRFRSLDRGHKGYLSAEEFLSIPELSINPVANLLERFFESINFKEFATTLSVFSSRSTREEKLAFMFKVYDVDGDGVLSEGDLLFMLRQLAGNSLTSEDRVEIVRRALAEAGVGEGGIDFETFQRVLKRTECQLQVDIPTQD